YTRKQGIEDTFIVAPADAPDWVQDRSALWNAAEAGESRRNSVTAREWEVALPAELSAEARSQIARDFAQALVDRYGVAADVVVHAPHREGDQRNHHAHILTTTRVMGEDGLGAKTRILDAAKTGGVEIEEMRGVWAQLQNHALEREGQEQRVDHRSLEAQREVALGRGEDLVAMELDRAPEIKLGPAANAMERQAMQAAEVDGIAYEPVTQRGAQNHAIRQRRDLLSELRHRAELAREVYGLARDQDVSRLSAAIEAAKTLFTSPGADDFAAGFSEAWQGQEDVRQQALAEERERERLHQLEEERALFVEQAAQAWESTRQINDPELAKERQGRVVETVERAAEKYGSGFEDLAGPINTRANEIRDDRLELERRQELELEKVAERTRDSGMDYGL
uniref:MobA/MobL family protein n=1 Tax=uncultured Aliiroseovarius sp. TaxID=1658783 RepID=UPI00259AE249